MAFLHDIYGQCRTGLADAVVTPGCLLTGTAETVRLWCHRARTRRELAELDAMQLADIGIDQHQARAEARKPFWRA